MFLTKIKITQKETISNKLSDLYSWHKTLWKAFQGNKGKKFLYRVNDQGQHFIVYILSHQKPMILNFGLWQTKKIPDFFLNQHQYRFQIRANPTKRLYKDNTGKIIRKRVGIYDEKGLNEWLERKSKQHGFEINSCRIQSPKMEMSLKNEKKILHNKVDYEGILKVVDYKLFKETFKNGIGSAKAFGFGMMVLQPLS